MTVTAQNAGGYCVGGYSQTHAHIPPPTPICISTPTDFRSLIVLNDVYLLRLTLGNSIWHAHKVTLVYYS